MQNGFVESFNGSRGVAGEGGLHAVEPSVRPRVRPRSSFYAMRDVCGRVRAMNGGGWQKGASWTLRPVGPRWRGRTSSFALATARMSVPPP